MTNFSFVIIGSGLLLLFMALKRRDSSVREAAGSLSALEGKKMPRV
jgi:hypothetical protein